MRSRMFLNTSMNDVNDNEFTSELKYVVISLSLRTFT